MLHDSLPIARAARSTPRAAFLALAALALLASPARASASASTADSARVARAPLSRTDDARMEASVRARVEAHRTRARAEREAGHLAAARAELLAAASLMRDAGVLPVNELRDASALAFAEGQPAASAALLDTLATDASAFGVPLEQARALADAAERHGQAGELDVASARLSELRMLLVSPPYPPAGYRANPSSRDLATR